MLGFLSKKSENASTAKIALWYTFGNFFVKGLVFLSAPIFARLLSKTEYGEFSNFYSWQSILAVIVTLDFNTSISRAKYDFIDKMDGYLSSILLTSNILTLLFYTLVEYNSVFFEKIFSMDIKYIRILFLYLFFSPAFSYMQTKYRIFREYKPFVAFTVISTLVRTIVAIILVLILQDKLFGRIIGDTIPVVVMCFVLWLFILMKGKRLDWECVKFASIISIPLIPHTVSVVLLGSSDRIMIMQFVGAEAAAIYTLAYQIGLITSLLWVSMNQAWVPWLYDNIHNEKYEKINKNSRIYLGVFSIIIVVIMLIAPEIILIIGGASYYDGRFIVPPVILGCAFQFVYGMYVNLEIYAKKTIMISFGTVMAALLNIGLNFYFIPRYGFIAASYTTLVGYMALFLLHFMIVKFKITHLSNLYNIRFISSILLSLSLISFCSLRLYQSNWLRYVIVFLYVLGIAFCAFKHKNDLKRLFGHKNNLLND